MQYFLLNYSKKEIMKLGDFREANDRVESPEIPGKGEM